MWLWQHKIMRKRHLLWVKLVVTSFVLHIICLSWVFFIYRNDTFLFSLTMRQSIQLHDAPIIFMPVSEVRSSTPPAYSVTQAKKKDRSKTMIRGKITPSIKKTKKVIQTNLKKQVNKKDIAAIKNPVQSPPQHKIQKIIDSKSIAIKLGYRDVETMRRYAVLQKELAKYWHPPVGMTKDYSCQIKMLINWSGQIQELEMVRSSGILMYDIAARSALHEIHMPDWVRGKSIIITFAQ